jgi:hypothetical protein
MVMKLKHAQQSSQMSKVGAYDYSASFLCLIQNGCQTGEKVDHLSEAAPGSKALKLYQEKTGVLKLSVM